MQVISILLLAGVVSACAQQQGPWGQCGGIGWTGPTSCSAGWTCVPQTGNPYYSQCLELAAANSPIPGSSTTTKAVATTSSSSIVKIVAPTTPRSTVKVAVPTTSTTTVKVAVPTTSISTVKVAVPTTSSTTIQAVPTTTSSSKTTSASTPATSGVTFRSSFTFYGQGDTFGSPNCQTNTAACGFFTSPGFAAAASQNLFGVGPGAGAGPACGTCWQLTGETDSSGNALTNAGTSIIVMVNNLCPAEGNPLCAQSGLTGTNQYGANVNFDLCEDSGAKAAFFGNDGVGLALGTATQVSCSLYSGTVVH